MTLLNVVLGGAVWILVKNSPGSFSGSPSSYQIFLTALCAALQVYCVLTIVPSVMLTIRRLHDSSRSGWWTLISLIPFVGGFILFYFMCADSDLDDNKYGSCLEDDPDYYQTA